MSIKSQGSRVAALVVACLVAVSLVAYAQTTSRTRGVAESRVVIAVFSANIADSAAIPDGTVLMVDTTTAASGTIIGVKQWPGTAITRCRIVGLALGNIPKRGQGVGQCLVSGYHDNAKMGASGLTTNAILRTGAGVNGSLLTTPDSLAGGVGIFLGYNSRSTVANSRGKVIITQPLGKFFGTLL